MSEFLPATRLQRAENIACRDSFERSTSMRVAPRLCAERIFACGCAEISEPSILMYHDLRSTRQ